LAGVALVQFSGDQKSALESVQLLFSYYYYYYYCCWIVHKVQFKKI